jgi:hypothetical protein
MIMTSGNGEDPDDRRPCLSAKNHQRINDRVFSKKYLKVIVSNKIKLVNTSDYTHNLNVNTLIESIIDMADRGNSTFKAYYIQNLLSILINHFSIIVVIIMILITLETHKKNNMIYDIIT